MSLTNWGDRIIDLTNDSDDNEDTPVAVPQPLRLPSTIAPVPKSVYHSDKPASVQQTNLRASSPRIPSSNPRDRAARTLKNGRESLPMQRSFPSVTGPAGMGSSHNGTTATYFPIHSRGYGTTNDQGKEQQAEKRRRLYTSTNQTTVPGDMQYGIGSSANGHGASTNQPAIGDNVVIFEETSGVLYSPQALTSRPELKTGFKSRDWNKTSEHSQNSSRRHQGANRPFDNDILAHLPGHTQVNRNVNDESSSGIAGPTSSVTATALSNVALSQSASKQQQVHEIINTNNKDQTILHGGHAKNYPHGGQVELVQKSELVDQTGSPSFDNSITYSMEGTKQRRLIFSGPMRSPHDDDDDDDVNDDVDSVISHSIIESDSEEPRVSDKALLIQPSHLSTPLDTEKPKRLDESLLVQPLHNSTPTVHQSGAGRGRPAAQFSEQEDHLLIFLKEVKKYRWKDIAMTMSHRKYPALQKHYSQTLNKRDRSKDPPVLNLPKRFAAEATIDWVTVHAECPGPEFSGQGTISSSAHQPGQYDYATPQPLISQGEIQHDFSLEAKSGSQRKRSRRGVPLVNYTWPRRGLNNAHDDEDEDSTDMTFPSTKNVDFFASSEQPSEELSEDLMVIPDKAVPVNNPPLQIDFDDEDADIGLNALKQIIGTSNRKIPYLSHVQRSNISNTGSPWKWDQLDSRDWQGSVLHVDFSAEELDLAERVIMKFVHSPESLGYSSQRRRLRVSLQYLSEPKLLKLSSKIRRRLPSRSYESIRAFLQDALEGRLSSRKRIGRVVAARPNKTYSSQAKLTSSSIVRNRELGFQSNRGWKASSRPLTYQLKNNVWDTLGPAFWWTGASSDVHTVAWSLDGQCFAAGAVAVSDPHSMQYNRPNNLLYGNTTDRTIRELGEHTEERTRTETGPNSTHAMYASQDTVLYQTVSSVAFSPSDRLLYSAGYDKHVCIWDVSRDETEPELVAAMNAKADIDMLTLNNDGLLAIAAKRSSNNSVKVVKVDEDNPSQFTWHNFHSQKAGQRPDQNILPTALKFDPCDGRALLAGFGANVRDDRLDTTGDICLWDVKAQTETPIHGSSKNVFDVAFNSNQRHMPWFAVGCVAGQNVNRGTRSLIRLYDGYGHWKYTMQMELECKALDMNDVVWCPYDEHLLAVGCTSGRAYVWDLRRADQFLRELGHGESLMPLEVGIDREITDTGIRFLSWGENATRLYSGSSDGTVKVWDVTRSEEETFIKDVITVDSGIMAGAFSPDKSKLILGEVHGTINVLEVGRDDWSTKDAERLTYIPYRRPEDEPTNLESGIEEAIMLLETEQMILAPMGGLPIRQALQGPEYAGPYDRSVDAPALREQALDFQLSLATNPEPQCCLESCKEGLVKITTEETGDSGRSKDRIPDELRQQWTARSSNFDILQGKSRCAACARPARPLPSATVSTAMSTFCERCSFACFRCGAINKIEPADVLLTCTSCERIWDMGSLGYECITQTGRVGKSLDVPALIGYGEDCHKSRTQDENDTSFGDELNALTDYYHSLAIDRPESPPL